MKKMKRGPAVAAGIIVLLAILPALPNLGSKRPENLGVTNDKLALCPDSPNCVSSFDEDEQHRIAPLPISLSADETMERITAAVADLPRTRIVTGTDVYLHAECTSLIYRYVDDLEILLDPIRKKIHFRSASRVGHSDLGVNRKRVESLRKRLSTKAHFGMTEPAANPPSNLLTDNSVDSAHR